MANINIAEACLDNCCSAQFLETGSQSQDLQLFTFFHTALRVLRPKWIESKWGTKWDKMFTSQPLVYITNDCMFEDFMTKSAFLRTHVGKILAISLTPSKQYLPEKKQTLPSKSINILLLRSKLQNSLRQKPGQRNLLLHICTTSQQRKWFFSLCPNESHMKVFKELVKKNSENLLVLKEQ